VDPAAPFLDKVVDKSYKLVAFDLAKNQVLEEYNLQGIVAENGYINDVRIDYRKNLAYLTNSNTGGIVVINLKDTSVSVNGNDMFFAKGETREFLKGTNFVLSDTNYHFKPNKGDILRNGENKAVRVQSDGITLSADGKTLFFKPLTDDKLYSIPTDLLGLEEFETCDEFKVSQVKDWGHISSSDGMATDAQGNIYLGDLENNAIVVFNPDNQTKKVLVQDERLQWADSFAIHGDYLYVACSQIHHLPGFNQGKSTRTTPYQLFKIKLKS
jgi:sugar lactone lactonase YvrE